MNILTSVPLRISIPVIFISFSLITAIIFSNYSSFKIKEELYENTHTSLRHNLVEKQGILQTFLRHNDTADIKRLLQTQITQNDTLATLICKTDGEILFASNRKFYGNIFSNPFTQPYIPYFKQVVSSQRIESFHHQENNDFYGFAPLSLYDDDGSLRPGNNGIYIEHQNIHKKLYTEIHHERLKNSVEIAIFMVAFLLTAFLLHIIVSKRLQKIFTAFDKYDGHSIPYISLKGNDEIAQLAETSMQLFTRVKQYQDTIEEKTLQAQAALYELKEQKLALDAHAIVSITDAQGKITYANRKFEEISGYDENELLGKDHRMINSGYHPSSFWKEMYHTLQQGKVWHQEVKNRAKDGSFYWVDSTIFPYLDIEGNIQSIISIRTDITEVKTVQESLHIAKEQAEESDRAKSSFLASMSHEIRTPMNGIIGFVEQLAKDETVPERIKKFSIIRESTQQLLTVLNDILDLSKIESGMMDIEQHPIHPHVIFEGVISVFSNLADEKDIRLSHHISTELPQCILGDQTRLKQVLFNLLSNAIKFTPEHGRVKLNVGYSSYDKRIDVSIEDTGVGIAKENISKIFDAFAQEDDSTTRKFGGTGLGLSISSKLLKMMHSKLQVESTLGEGSRFYFTLHVDECTLEPIKEDSTEHQSEHNSFKGHVLLVEDNKTNQMLLGFILDDVGLTHDIAQDGVEAVTAFKNKKYDLILMDENMPNMNGIEATRHIRNEEREDNRQSTPIIAVTANSMAEDRQKFLDAGMDDYVAKPYEEKDIINLLHKYLHR